jgi:hypothetical protein
MVQSPKFHSVHTLLSLNKMCKLPLLVGASLLAQEGNDIASEQTSHVWWHTL